MLLALAYVLLLAIVSLEVPLALSLRDRVNAEVRSQARAQVDVVAATAADMVRPPMPARLATLARTAAASVRGRVIMVDGTGRILADSAGNAEIGHGYGSRPEIAAALSGRSYQGERASRTLGEQILATAVPIIRSGRTVGAVRITQSVAAVHRAVERTILALALVGAVVLVLGLGAGALIAEQIARPLRRLQEVARRVSGGDLAARAKAEGSIEQRSLSSAFNEMTERTERLLRSQQDFIADASHQLRTPLTGLRLRIEEAEAAGVDPPAHAELEAALAEVDRLAVIVDDLLLLSRAGEREVSGERVDLIAAARAAVERWQSAAAEHTISLRNIEPRVPDSAWCSRADLDHALDALIDNALRYSPAGTQVTVGVVDHTIEVSDQGPGLAEDEREVVFERFHRGQAGHRTPGGSGLGLPIARALARRWGGDVSLWAGEQRGTRAELRMGSEDGPG